MGESKRFTLIERSAMTFESFLGREFGNRFYSDEFLTGISSRRLELHARLARSSGLAFTFATLIAFFDLIAGSAFSYSGLTLQITKDLMPILALFAAGAFLQMTFTFIDEQIVFRILTKIGAKIDVHHFPLLLVDKAAINLWADALAPRYFGPKSGFGQKASFAFLAFVALTANLALYLYAPAMIAVVTYQTFANLDSRLVTKGISALSCLVVIWALLLGIFSGWKFKFQPADWIESTNKPTEEFAAQMRAELAAEQATNEA
ncbi:MAG: hypothetical protein M9895_19475 [Aquamicrobium sp.]|uniref:hypothetical protein n=1 Tax=Aquamicrobium sp. TaxID=1872579 RepID=UPI00349EFF40|nr:hypothetical protein [Aquamicrobium sp.]MCO5156416.1 hypothetical protein [Aquamicrobium sp.]